MVRFTHISYVVLLPLDQSPGGITNFKVKPSNIRNVGIVQLLFHEVKELIVSHWDHFLRHCL